MCLQELYKLFDWSGYKSEQEQMLNSFHKESHWDARQTKKTISDHEVGMVQISPPQSLVYERKTHAIK